MKKSMRFIALALAFLIACFAFCGCDFIEEARKEHAVWKNNEKTLIELNGKEYKLLPECDFLNPVCDYYNYTVTDSDVPLLLAEMYGEYVSVSKDKNFIIVDGTEELEPTSSYYEPAKIYCAVEYYDKVKKQIENGVELNCLCYEYLVFDEETFDYLTKLYKFTEEEKNAVSSVISQGKTTTMDVYAGNTEAYFEIYKCSEEGMFRKSAFDLVLYSSKAYLVYNDYEEGEGATYVVPDELYPTFRKIATDYMESMGW